MQYSVFECLVEPAQWVELRARLLEEADLSEDSLRFYFLGSNYDGGLATWGRMALRPGGSYHLKRERCPRTPISHQILGGSRKLRSLARQEVTHFGEHPFAIGGEPCRWGFAEGR